MTDFLEMVMTNTDQSDMSTLVRNAQISKLSEDGRDKVMRAKIMVETIVAANVQLLVETDPDLTTNLLKTSAGCLKGGPDPSHPQSWKYVLIILDTKAMGESNNKPRLRMQPANLDEVRRLVEVARGRNDIPAAMALAAQGRVSQQGEVLAGEM
ncbi:MAG: hypothetical protein ACKPKO_42560, partial [Candidatus Fonsibacter sp.]